MESDQSAVDGVEQLKAQLSRILCGFSCEITKDKYAVSTYKLEASDFPVPELILYTLRDVLGWQWHGREEKVRWTVYGSVGGEFVSFQFAKFGLRFSRSHFTEMENSRILCPLGAAIKAVEKNIRPQAKNLIEQGKFTMVNRFGEFTDRYKFFREKADASFKAADNPPDVEEASGAEVGFAGLAGFLNHKHEHVTSGFYNSVAMIDCYFSGLEHRLLLMRAFSGVPLGLGGFREFMEISWEQKIGLFLDVKKNKSNRDMLGHLKAIKDRIRNPFAHGGFENDKGAIFLHFPTLGAIPANFTDFAKSSRFTLFPIESENFTEICSTFDQLDQVLSINHLWGIHRFVETGVDPSFDEVSLKNYAEAIIGGESDVERLIDRWGRAYEVHANMDY